MKIRNINFNTWCANHPPDHDAIWCRALYPWDVFSAIDYDRDNVGLTQKVEANQVEYSMTIRNIYIGQKNRLNYMIELKSNSSSKTAEWENISWDSQFHLVASYDGDFITLFTEKKDPAKSLLGSFMGSDFPKVEAKRCLPYSGLLFRTLVWHRAEELFSSQKITDPFEWIPDGFRKLTPHPKFPQLARSITPLWANGRTLWVTSAWTEEKAHRFALYNANQCDELVVVYCHPTFSSHHRCSYPKTKITSLLNFVSGNQDGKRSVYHRQAKFLIQNLRIHDIQTKKQPLDSSCYASEIKKLDDEKTFTIPISLLREAKSGMEFEVATSQDAAYFFSCANLLNAALTGRYGIGSIPRSLPKEVYSFKAQVGRVVEYLIKYPIDGIEIYFDDRLLYVTIDGIQFSFHAIPRTPPIRNFIASKRNRKQCWSGIRLQPISPLVMDWGRAKFIER